MFNRPIRQVPEVSTRVSEASPLRTRRERILRLTKRSSALLLLAVGVAALLIDAGHISSDGAVVTAQVVSVRSPIEGVVQMRAGTFGEQIAAGTVLAEVINPLVDELGPAALHLQSQRLRAELDALLTEKAHLSALQEDLADRAERHRSAKVKQLAADVRQMESEREAKHAELLQLVKDLDRKRTLREVVPAVEMERAGTAARIAADQLAALDQRAAAARAITEAAEHGLMVEANGGNDVAYSEQRADEIRIRLVEVDHGIAVLQAQAEEAERHAQAEAARVAQMRSATVRVPSQGMIWRLGSGPGERVRAGDLLAQVVDCSSAFLAVDVPQERVTDIDLNAPVRFRLAGERVDRTGRITAVTGDTALRENRALAAVPAAPRRPVTSVIVAVPPSPNVLDGCLVGRSARVTLPATRLDWLAPLRHVMPL